MGCFNKVARRYALPIAIGKMIARILPLIVVYGFLTYVMLAAAYLAANPQLIVKASFGLFDLVPAYANFVLESMLAEVRAQLAERLR